MLLQTLLLVTILTVLGSSILASTLVSAKAAFHAKVLRAGESAMNDATADFVAWAQKNVRDNGIDQMPVWSAAQQTIGPSPACVEPVAAAQVVADAASCKLYETIHWNVTGYSGSPSTATTASPESLAAGLSTSQDEQRVSATLMVAITDASQSVQYGTRAREITARVFHSAPYATVTAERDAASEVGAISSAEGDTAGYAMQDSANVTARSTPYPSSPAAYTNTMITTTVDCINSTNNSSPDAFADDNNVFYSRLRPYGNLAWIYELPCKPMQSIDPQTAPIGYEPAVNNVYRSQAATNAEWSKGDANDSTFAW